MNYWAVKTIIQESPIQGMGRFSIEDIKEGAVVVVINGVVERGNAGNGKFPIGNGMVMLNDPSYINHSVNNNLKRVDVITFIAKVDILKGDELTMDYSEIIDDIRSDWTH